MAAKRALVVDDSKSARVVLSRMLEKYGDAYRMYQRQVPMFVPRLRAMRRQAEEA